MVSLRHRAGGRLRVPRRSGLWTMPRHPQNPVRLRGRRHGARILDDVHEPARSLLDRARRVTRAIPEAVACRRTAARIWGLDSLTSATAECDWPVELIAPGHLPIPGCASSSSTAASPHPPRRSASPRRRPLRLPGPRLGALQGGGRIRRPSPPHLSRRPAERRDPQAGARAAGVARHRGRPRRHPRPDRRPPGARRQRPDRAWLAARPQGHGARPVPHPSRPPPLPPAVSPQPSLPAERLRLTSPRSGPGRPHGDSQVSDHVLADR